jgi:hypothetical protein
MHDSDLSSSECGVLAECFSSPWQHVYTLSPCYLLTRQPLDYKKHVCLEFGAYIQTHEEHTNGDGSQNHWCDLPWTDAREMNRVVITLCLCRRGAT